MSFALPVCCTGPAVLMLGLILFITQAEKLDGAAVGNIPGTLSNIKAKNVSLLLLHPLNAQGSATLQCLPNHFCQIPSRPIRTV